MSEIKRSIVAINDTHRVVEVDDTQGRRVVLDRAMTDSMGCRQWITTETWYLGKSGFVQDLLKVVINQITNLDNQIAALEAKRNAD